MPWEKEMATHSSVLAWGIPGTGEPSGLPSTGSHRVGHYWSDLAAAAAVLKASSRCLQEAHGWSDRCSWHVSYQLCLPRSSPTLARIRGTCWQSRCFPWRDLLVPDHCRSCRGNPPWGCCLLKLPTIKVSPALKAGSHCYGAMRPLLLPQPSGPLIECYGWGRGSF